MQQPTPHYYRADSAWLMGASPQNYLGLSNTTLLGMLRQMESTGRSYRKFLPLYPHVCCEPLEFFYLCRKNIDALDEHLLNDFLFAFGWREANWGAWIAALAPKPEYAAPLRQRRSALPHGARVIDLALAACGEPVAEGLAEHHQLRSSIARMLGELPSAHVPLRLEPGPAQAEQWRKEAAQARAAYLKGGVAAVQEQTRQGLLRYYGQSHQEWWRNGARMLTPQ
jgi:hypothetical protein